MKENNYHFIEEYVDDGYTGTNFERPSFQRMLKDVKTKKINMILVKDLSRIGRNNSKVSHYIEEYFPRKEVRFIAIDNNYDSDVNNASKEYAWLTNGINETYCLDISKKVRSALYIRKKKGYFTGFKAPYGYQRDKEDKHKLVIDTKVEDIVKKIFSLAYEGKSPSQIASILSLLKVPTPSDYANLNRRENTKSLWCDRTIRDMLTNETYIGNLTQGRRKKINYKVKKEVRTPKEEWIIVEKTHPAIIEKHIFDTVQNMIKIKSKNNKENTFLLRGLLYCKECNHKIGILKSKDQKRAYLSCNYYRKYSKFNLCTPHTMNYQKLEEEILRILKIACKENIDKEKIIEKEIKRNQKKKENIEKEIEKRQKKIEKKEILIDKIYIDSKEGNLEKERFERIKKEIEEEIQREKEKISILKKPRKEKTKEEYRKELESFLLLQKIPKSLLVNLIDKVYIWEDKKVEVYLKWKPTSSKI